MKKTTSTYRSTLLCGLCALVISLTKGYASEIEQTTELRGEIGETTEMVASDDDLNAHAIVLTETELVVTLPFEEQTVIIYDITGRVWYKNDVNGNKQLYISRANLPSALVLVEIVSKKGQRRVYKLKL